MWGALTRIESLDKIRRKAGNDELTYMLRAVRYRVELSLDSEESSDCRSHENWSLRVIIEWAPVWRHRRLSRSGVAEVERQSRAELPGLAGSLCCLPSHRDYNFCLRGVCCFRRALRTVVRESIPGDAM